MMKRHQCEKKSRVRKACNAPSKPETPRMPAGVKPAFDKDGWRH